MEYKEKIIDIAKKVANKKLIGNDLIEYINNKEFEEELHKLTDRAIISVSNDTIFSQKEKYCLIVALTYIAMKDYDNSFWPYVENFYNEVIKHIGSKVLMENSIRDMLNDVIPENKGRQIDYIISNAIVPMKHLDDFFDFVFDIYKINFEFSLPLDDYKNDLYYIYESLKDKTEENRDEIQIEVTNKTYKLRIGTLNIIKTQKDIYALIDLTSNVLEIIDYNYYNENIELLNKEYYKYGFNKWISNVSKKEKIVRGFEETREKNFRWKPKYTYKNGNIVLDIPMHRILNYKKKNIDPYSIEINVYNENILIYKNETPTVEKGIEILKVLPDSITLDAPLGRIRYTVSTSKEILYDSKESLYRENIFFNALGQEIKKYKQYEGTAFFCFNEIGDKKLKIIINKEHYKIGTYYVKPEDIFYFKNEIVSFSGIAKPGVFGEKYNKARIIFENDYVYIYKKIEKIVIQTDKKIQNIFLKVNNIPYRKNRYSIDIQYINDLTYLTIYSMFDKGYYDLKISTYVNDKNMESFQFKFFIDNNFDFQCNKIDEHLYRINLSSDIKLVNKNLEKVNEYFFNTEIELEPKIYYQYNNIYYYINFNLDIPMYKIDNQTWKEFDKCIFEKDINVYSKLKFRGIDFDLIKVVDEEDNFIKNLEPFKEHYEIGSFINFYDMYNFIELLFIKNEQTIKQLRVYFHATINLYTSYINYDKLENKIKFKINYDGDFKLRVMVSEGERRKIYKSSSVIKKNKEYSTCEIQPLKNYIFSVIEEPNKPFDIKKIVYMKNIITYTRGALKGKEFYICFVEFTTFENEKEILNTRKLYSTFIKFLDYKKEKDEYIAVIFQRKNGKKIEMYNIYPLYVKVEEDIIDGKMKLQIHDIYNENIMIDTINNTILNSSYSKFANDVEYVYIML